MFKNEILSNNKRVFLHSNPNNAGIEVEPVLEEESNKYISFQAKFFNNKVSYKQIENSLDKVVEHYKDQLDIVYLFCNMPISKKCESFKRIQSKLNAVGIELVLITDTAILDIVKEHAVIANYYFNHYLITQEKLVEKTKTTVDAIGERFNPNFNVETSTSKNLSVFLNSNRSIEYFNNKKTRLIEKLGSLSWGIRNANKYASKLKECVLNIPDVGIESINEVKNWDVSINQNLKKEIEEIKESITTLEKEHNKTEELKKKRKLKQEINELKKLLELFFSLKISKIDSEMLDNKILIVRGETGVGKTQLFANEAVSLIDEGENSLLLIGGEILSQEPILQQIKKNLDIDFSFEDIIDYLEMLGEKRGRIIPIFIDALNESWDVELWKSTLSALYRKIINKNYVRLAISFRTEYQKTILPDDYSEKKGVAIITHRGFRDNPIEATKKFFNHYGIAFTPVHMFDRNLDNPLFLNLYCKTYEGDEVDLPTLYDRIIEKTNKQIHKSMAEPIRLSGFDKSENIVLPIMEEISKYSLKTGKKSFEIREIEEVLDNNPFGLNARALITNLIKENILCDQEINGDKYVFFAFDQMNDYFSAKTIFSQLRTEEEIIDYLMSKVLYNDEGTYTGRRKKGLFVNICNLYANTFNKECIDIIEKIENQDEQHYLFNAYIDSLKWRSNIYMSITDIMKLCENHRTERDLLWDVFINNSLKRNHFMNAKGLHNVLFEYSLPNRDYLWTIYINELASEEDRLVQLIEAIRKKEIDFDTEQVKLLLVLLSWILTSSNRWLRDVTSKAIVELLKNNFNYSKWLLETFSGVNDPYIIQRLYGVVFGASVKRNSECKEDFESLVIFIFEEIFESDSVYPDILLRDYVRLIIERYNYEYPKEIESKKFEKIIPPYKSDEIPEIDDEKYLDKKWDKGLYYIKIYAFRWIRDVWGFWQIHFPKCASVF